MNEISKIKTIRQVIKDNDSFAVAGHVRPDGDAIGSCAALGMALEKMGKEVHILLEDASEKYDIIPGKHLLYCGDIDTLKPQVFVCVDFSAYDRLGEPANIIGNSEIVICVDHHLNSNIHADYEFIDDTASSTSELIYRLLDGFVDIDKNIAAAIYAGIVYDTGGFKHSCTTPAVYRIAADLMERDIPFTRIYNELLFRHSKAEAAVFGTALSNMKIVESKQLAYSFVTDDELAKHGALPKDIDGVTEYLLNIRNVTRSVFLYEIEPREVKVSFRSTEEDISKIALKFGGGGHKNAAGCTICAPLDDAISMILAEFE